MSSVVRIVLTDGASIIASCELTEGLVRGRTTMVTLTDDEAVERVPVGAVAEIEPWDSQMPMSANTSVYRFATFP